MTDAPLDTAGHGSSLPRRLIAIVAVGAAAIAAGAWWLVDQTETTPPLASSASEAPTTDDATVAGVTNPPDPSRPAEPPIVSTGLWPDPPLDHDPHVLGRPGSGPVIPNADGLSLLYVNSIGRPTLIDLATGDREELDIASTRRYDRFEIAGGHVVAVSKAERSRLRPGAITVRVERPQLFDLAFPSAPATGIDLCLAPVCPQLRAVAGANPRVGPLDPERYPELARLLDGDTGPVGRFVSVTFGGVTTPIPTRGPGPVWMIHEG